MGYMEKIIENLIYLAEQQQKKLDNIEDIYIT